MFKEQMNKIKALIVRNAYDEEKVDNKKRKLENLVAFLIISIITIIIINTILNDDKNNKNDIKESTYKELAVEENNTSFSNELEDKIENILGTMSGVRKGKCFSFIF